MKQQFSLMCLIKILFKTFVFYLCIFYSYLWHCCSGGKIHDFFHHLPSLGKMDDAHIDSCLYQHPGKFKQDIKLFL